MKAVILAGGLGTRFAEETSVRPKPMIEIGGKPILWHIMKIYSHWGINEFIVCLGYKGYLIKEYFANYYLHNCDITYDFSNNSNIVHKKTTEDWKVTLVDTGELTMTGGRIKRIIPYVKNDESFCLTYGDGVSSVNIAELVKFHESNGKIATLTAVQPEGRFGALNFDGDKILQFKEKPKGDGVFINGGFFVLSPKIDEYLHNDTDCVFEQEPLRKLAEDGQLDGFKHNGFWQPMDTLADKKSLEKKWETGTAEWKLWK
jgi:glucose-1-phosphate cytidylyltransferase